MCLCVCVCVYVCVCVCDYRLFIGAALSSVSHSHYRLSTGCNGWCYKSVCLGVCVCVCVCVCGCVGVWVCVSLARCADFFRSVFTSVLALYSCYMSSFFCSIYSHIFLFIPPSFCSTLVSASWTLSGFYFPGPRKYFLHLTGNICAARLWTFKTFLNDGLNCL